MPSWSTPPRPRGGRSPFPSVSPASLGKTSSSCISCATPRGRLVRGQEGRSGAARVRCCPSLRVRRGRLVDREPRLRAVRRNYPDRYLRLRYEDLARAPDDAMRDLFAKLLPGSEWRADEIGGSDTRHQLYGNRMRAANLSLAEVKEDARWQRDMPRVYRSLVSLLTAPLRWRYGYD